MDCYALLGHELTDVLGTNRSSVAAVLPTPASHSHFVNHLVCTWNGSKTAAEMELFV